MADKSPIARGKKFNVHGPGSFLHAWKEFKETVEALAGMRMLISGADNTGNGVQSVDCSIEMGPNGFVIIIPRSELGSGTGGDTTAARFHYKDDLGDCLRCRPWDGTTETETDVYVAKQQAIRTSYISAVQNGTTYTFSYGSTTDAHGEHYWQRSTSYSGGVTLISDIEPPFLYNDEIFAMPIAAVTLNSQSCSYIDTSPRAWAARQ